MNVISPRVDQQGQSYDMRVYDYIQRPTYIYNTFSVHLAVDSTVVLAYRRSGTSTWNYMPMTKNGSIYSATPNLTPSQWYDYYIIAQRFVTNSGYGFTRPARYEVTFTKNSGETGNWIYGNPGFYYRMLSYDGTVPPQD